MTVEGIAKIVRAQGGASGSDTLLVVDAITGLGTTHLDVDGWGVERDYRRVAEGADDASWAGVLRGQRACVEVDGCYHFATPITSIYAKSGSRRRKASRAYTPATSLFAALGAALEFCAWHGQGRLSQGTRRTGEQRRIMCGDDAGGSEGSGLKLYASSPAAALTAICAPDGTDSSKIVERVPRGV